MPGEIIAITGSPAAGKTFLAEKLAAHYSAELVYEQPAAGFPWQICRNLETQTNLFETIVWFRNQQIANYETALRMADEGRIVVLDTPFYQNQLYVGLYVKDQFSQDILYDMGGRDMKQHRHPDCTVHLSTTAGTIQEFLQRRQGARQWENQAWLDFITAMAPHAQAYMDSVKNSIPNFVEIRRSDFDFEMEEDLSALISRIDAELQQ
ncbi:AAA family ATPase [Candidatus Woesearchaeota archaeon]|nr:AAA family ATPase [Candidatus Woesearchaeota archaeon]